MTTYDRVILVDGRRVILSDLRRIGFLGSPAVTGLEVDAEGAPVSGDKGADRCHIISTSEIRRIVPLRMNLKYAKLERTTEDARTPYYPSEE